MKELFHIANVELNKVFKWINANKSSLNKDKTKYTFFHKVCEKERLPSLFINDREIKRITSIKYLGVLTDEHLTWKEHIAVIENKISKNLGLLHRARRVLDSKVLTNQYFSFIHSYLNYGNIVWVSKSTKKLKKLSSKQKQALRILNNEFTDIREIMIRTKVLNIYKLNIYQILNFMFKIKANTAPCIFQNQFTEIQHQYLSRFSKNSFVESQLVYSQTNVFVSSRGLRLWNKLLD